MILNKNRVAGVVLGLAMGAGGAIAGEVNSAVSYEGTCLAPISAFKDGMPAIESVETLNADQKIIETTKMFKEALGAFAEVQTCHQGMVDDSAGDNFAALYAGTRETSRVFELVQSQFESSIEEMSAEALSDMAPAAGEGAEADLAGEAQTLNTMEILMDSYMALERSQELARSLLKVNS
ncbi:MAG: hypothetical protein HWE25_01960 [Alphaproteobacteria bacterium]|nr:hypothetical protein [Alphaproteobacteria bacterium]